MRLWKSKTSRSNLITLALVTVIFVLVTLLRNGGAISYSMQGQLVPICAWIIMAVSLNLTVGILGELSLGHAGFMSVGAFAGVVTIEYLRLFISNNIVLTVIAVFVGMLFAALAGVIVGIPALRLKGDYLAIVTLAFGEIIKNVLNCVYVSTVDGKLLFSMFNTIDEPNAVSIVNGAIGANISQKMSSFGVGFVLVIITLVIVMNVVHSKEGRAIKAIRDNSIAAESVGINITTFKMKGFVLSAALAGMAGVLFATEIRTVTAQKFDFNTSINVLVMVVLGGMGSIRGSVIAAVILTILPEKLRFMQDYRMLIYAVILILVMVLNLNKRISSLFKNLTSRKNSKEVANQ